MEWNELVLAVRGASLLAATLLGRFLVGALLSTALRRLLGGLLVVATAGTTAAAFLQFI